MEKLKPCHDICCAIKRDGRRCTLKKKWTIPNIISGTGVGKDDWKYGRDVHLCGIHAKPFNSKPKRPVKLIEGGFLQAYNEYGYGSIVLDNIIDWKTVDKKTIQYQPTFWNRRAGDKDKEGK